MSAVNSSLTVNVYVPSTGWTNANYRSQILARWIDAFGFEQTGQIANDSVFWTAGQHYTRNITAIEVLGHRWKRDVGGAVTNNSYGSGLTWYIEAPPAPEYSFSITNDTPNPLTLWLSETNSGGSVTRTPVTLPPGGSYSRSGITNGFALEKEDWYWTGELGGWATNRSTLDSWSPSEGSGSSTGTTPPQSNPVDPNDQPVFNSPTTDDQRGFNAVVSAIQQHEQSNTKGQAAIFTELKGTHLTIEQIEGNQRTLIGIVSNMNHSATNIAPFSQEAFDENVATIFDTSGMSNFARGQMEQIDGMAADLQGMASDAASLDYSTGAPDIWNVTIGDTVYNLNPLQNSLVAGAVAWIRIAVSWLVCIISFRYCFNQFMDVMSRMFASLASSNMSNVEAAGVAASAVASDGAALGVYIAAKTAAIFWGLAIAVGIPVTLAVVIKNRFGGFAALASHPFEPTAQPYVNEAIRLLDAFIPLGFTLSSIFVCLASPLILTASSWVFTGLIKLTK